MVTVKCPHCGYVVAEGQTTCSQCERPVTSETTGSSAATRRATRFLSWMRGQTTTSGTSAHSPGSRHALKYLPDEADLGDFRTISECFKLTTKRLIFESESKRLLVLPGGQDLSAAMLHDVDHAFLGRKQDLPVWVGWLGVVAVGAALGAESGLGVIIGGAIVAAWYFLGSTVLEFRVDGEPLGTLTVVSAGGVDQELATAKAFVEKVFAAKAQSSRPA